MRNKLKKIITRSDLLFLSFFFLWPFLFLLLSFFAGIYYEFGIFLILFFFFVPFLAVLYGLILLIQKKWKIIIALIIIFYAGRGIGRILPPPMKYIIHGAKYLLVRSNPKRVQQDAMLLIQNHKHDLDPEDKFDRYILKDREIPESLQKLNTSEIQVYREYVFLFKNGRHGYYINGQGIYWNNYAGHSEEPVKLY